MKPFTLPNGVKCILHDTKCNQSVTVNIMFRVGSRDEPINYYGLTHFAEHMFFKGTSKRPNAKQISAEIDQYGGIMNATTDYEVTSYYVTIAFQHLEVALDVLSDLLFNALFRQEDIDKEKEVVVNELKMYQSSPERVLNMLMGENVFKNTPLEHDIGGDINRIRKATRDQFLAYVSHYYQPQNTVVSIVGRFNIPENKMKILVKKYFNQPFLYKNQIKNKKYKNKKFSERKLCSNFISMQKSINFAQKVFSDINNDFFSLGFPSWKFNCHEYYTCLIIGTILGNGMSSRLFQNIREKEGLVYKINTDIDSYQDMGNFSIVCACHQNDTKKVYRLILKELDILQKELVTLDEITKAKQLLIGNEMLRREKTSYIAQQHAYELVAIGKIMKPNEFSKKIKQINPSDIKKVAKQLFNHQKQNIIIVSSKKITKKSFLSH